MFKEIRSAILKLIRNPIEGERDGDFLFMKGVQNKCIKYFKYFNDGSSLFGSVENVVVKVSAVYFFLNLTNIWIAVGAAVGWVIVNFTLGWYQNHYMIRVMEEINLKISSHYGKKSYQAQQDTPELLKQILEELKKKNG